MNETEFRVIDAMDAPYRGQILRLRITEGDPPSIKSLKKATLVARAPDGREVTLRVFGFPHAGGKPSDRRFRRTGRIDLLVEAEEDGGPRVSRQWTVMGVPSRN